MALASDLGLTHKVVSERHYLASQTQLTAGEAAKFITKTIGKKVTAKELKDMYEDLFGCNMEWHHSGFYRGDSGKRMGVTYFISPKDTQSIINNFDELYASIEKKKSIADEDVHAFFWKWCNYGSNRHPRWGKKLDVYTGKRSKLPKNSTICAKKTYEAALKHRGRIYIGYDEPSISDFTEEDKDTVG